MTRVGLATATVLVMLWVATILAFLALRDAAAFVRWVVVPIGVALTSVVLYRRRGPTHR